MHAAYRIETLSGSIYELSENASHFRRQPGAHSDLRGDNTWLPIHLINGQAPTPIAVLSITFGERVTIITEPLGEGADYTMRRTSEVVNVTAIRDVMPSDDILASLEQLTEQEAIALLEREGCTYQVTSRDGRRLVQVRDYKPNRVNLDIVDGRVDSYGLG